MVTERLALRLAEASRLGLLSPTVQKALNNQQQGIVTEEDEVTLRIASYDFEPARVPFIGDIWSEEGMIMGLVLWKLAQTPQGLKVIETLGKEYVKGLFDCLHALCQASGANKVSAWGGPYLVSLFFERFGFVDSHRMAEFRIGLSVIAGADVAISVAKAIAGIVPFTKPAESDYPNNIVYSARSEGGVVTHEAITFRGKDFRKLEELRGLVGKKGEEET